MRTKHYLGTVASLAVVLLLIILAFGTITLSVLGQTPIQAVSELVTNWTASGKTDEVRDGPKFIKTELWVGQVVERITILRGQITESRVAPPPLIITNPLAPPKPTPTNNPAMRPGRQRPTAVPATNAPTGGKS